MDQDQQPGAGEQAGPATAASASLDAGFAKVRGADAPPAAAGTGAGPGAGEGGGMAGSRPPPAPGPRQHAGHHAGHHAAHTGSPDTSHAPASSAVEGLSDETLRALLAKVPDLERQHQATAAQVRQAFGKFGEIQQAIQALQPRAADSQPARRIKADALKRLTAEFGPQLAEAVSADLSEVLGGEPPPGQPASAPPTGPGHMTVEQRLEMRLLTKDHPDWKTLPGTPDFKLWLQGQSAAFRQQLEDSWDADFLSQVFSHFKGYRNAMVQRRQSQSARLDRAMPAPSSGRPRQAVLPDAAGLLVGFNKVRGGARR